MTESTTEIRVTRLHKAFEGKAVLRGVDLEIPRGDLVAVVGGSGCGKTVLMNHILGLLVPDQGRVEVADHERDGAPLTDLANLDDKRLALLHTHWGVVFQSNALFSGTVYDNIRLWLDEIKHMPDSEIVPVARRVLEAVSLPSDEAFLDTDIGSLSGGMAKRLATARALSMDPELIFYDEPTTGLDPTSAAQVQDLIRATHEARADATPRTTVIITHDKDLLGRLRPRMVMLHQGQVFFDGSFEDFAESESPVVRPYFDLMPVLHQRRQA